MQIETLRRLLDDPAAASSWLQGLGLVNPARGQQSLVRLATGGLTLDLLADLADQLAEHLPGTSDPDMALNNLDRFFAAARNPLSLGTLFERDREALPILLQLFSTSQYLSDLLITDAESYDLVRMTAGQPVSREVLVDEITSEVASLSDERLVMAALRRFKRRETLRISYGDIIREQPLATVSAQISYLADALIEGALVAARRKLGERRGTPRRADRQPAQFVVLALGKLGGVELNYSSDIDLVFLYDEDGMTDGRQPQTNLEYFDRLIRALVKLLAEVTELGYVYRVDLRLRPLGERGPTVQSLEAAWQYYDVLGRTWERQAYVKARPVAGDLELGQRFLRRLEPWIYRRYLGLADITGIKALKRRIERRTLLEGVDDRNVKTGHGGIRDIEFVIQFLQLLNGGDLENLRTGNTLLAIAELEKAGCLTHQERSLLESNYSFLRKIEHRQQIMFDLQTHLLPEQPEELRKVAIRMGYADTPERTALAAFLADLRTKTDVNRRMLDHLLHQAFPDDAATEPEVDLVLDPAPPLERIAEVLARHRFRNVQQAYDNLMALSEEKVRFLSTRRCRHFLAAIAPALLKAIAATPDPDSTLVNLVQVSDSLGGKGVLWELFSFNEPSLRLYVELCASSPYLSSILTSNPGMIDDLMDSLVLNKLPELADLRELLDELCRGAEDIEPILHSFKNAQVLAVGVRDILGKEDIKATNAALSDIAEACLERIALDEYRKLVEKLGEPLVGSGERAGMPCELMIVALGKFGGREMTYRSDLDIVFLYQADGQTHALSRSRRSETTTNNHFFSELGQRIIKVSSQLGPFGRLFEVDPRLRPTGRSGVLATSLAEFERYYANGEAQLWERQALCKARVVFGSPHAAAAAWAAIGRAAYEHPWQHEWAAAIRDMRRRIELNASRTNLKRGPGGLVDVEFLVQMLQLRYGADEPAIRQPNTLDALAALHAAGHIDQADLEYLAGSYRFLRTLEARLRLMNSAAHHDVPDDPIELDKLARPLGYSAGQELLADFWKYTEQNRQRFERLLLLAEAAV
ncbi:MAG: bifunctional [glutamate--ammonia ligase]-adenylyl-L-tyrosine phosphorylase/[glutamate--ammonia-ligase] adenylyltransferase [Pirellulales bacterium]|nr:bifunctional [glutamate--ammonia ligase]-adenylyl-L-tyrosine phosphorylase/[glutamate--ammonia-ligase] adenylyltransferase [Pirellulales bacterium]